MSVAARGERGEENSDIFILDSGASINIINNLLYIKSFKTLHKPDHITTAGGHKLSILGVGYIDGIGEVFYVPESKRNLISISQLTKSGREVTFTNNRVFIDDIEIGVISNKLYVLNKRPEYEEEEAHSAEEVFVNDGHIEQDHNIISKDSTISSLKIDLLHKRFAHTNVASIKELIRCGACDGLERITHQQASPNTYHCEACSMAKATKHSRDPSKKAKRNLTAVSKELYFQAVYTDLIGPMQVRAPGGFYYGITFTELTSRFRYFYPLRRKSDALNAFKQLVAEVEADGFKIKLLKSDNGGEYVSEDFKTYCAQEKIVQRFTSPHTPQSNSISERFNRVLGEKCRAMLIGANLPMSLWAECMKTATYISNRVISPTHRCKTPYELIYGAKPDVSHLRAFGCIAYFYNFDIDRRKLDNKAHKGVLVGYDLQSASYLVYSPESRTVRKTGHVLFNEHLLYYTTPCKDIEVMDMDNLEQPSNRVKDNALPTNKQLATTTTTVAAAEAPPNSTPLRKSTRARQQPDRLAFSAEECAYSVETLLHGADDFEFPDEDFDSEAGDAPANLRDIYKRSDQTEWFAAIDSENKSLFKHGVFEVVESVPAGKNLVKARYIFKRKSDGRYKARLVAKGYSQKKVLIIMKFLHLSSGKSICVFFFLLLLSKTGTYIRWM